MIDESKIELCKDKGHHGKINYSQEITVTCDECGVSWTCSLRARKNKLEKWGKDLCRSCNLKLQYKLGTRKSCFGEYNKTVFAGPWEKRYGEEKAAELKDNLSKKFYGDKHPMYGRYTENQRNALEKRLTEMRGKTLEEIYGVEKAVEIRKNISEKTKGELNPMFGRPSPNKSGHGIGGWYKNKIYFRSLLELSFLIMHEHDEVLSAEHFAIPYEYENVVHTYHPDFQIGNTIYEIKAEWQKNSECNAKKFFKAEEFCEKNNYIFTVLTEKAIPMITVEKVKELELSQVIRLDKHERIFKERKHGNHN